MIITTDISPRGTAFLIVTNIITLLQRSGNRILSSLFLEIEMSKVSMWKKNFVIRNYWVHQNKYVIAKVN